MTDHCRKTRTCFPDDCECPCKQCDDAVREYAEYVQGNRGGMWR